MKILITGGNGYLGSRLCQFLSLNGHQVTAVCHREKHYRKNWNSLIHQIIYADIKKIETIKQISSIKTDVLIHLVSLDQHNSEKDNKEAMDINVLPTWNLLEQCTANGLKKFIYFSTIHVYGHNQNGLVEETQSPTPINAYGLTHYLSEKICNYYMRKADTDCINIRLSNSYGSPVFSDANCWDLILNDITRSAFIEKKIVLKTDGSAIRDFIHFSDICNGINKILNVTEFNGKNTIHFSSSKSLTMLDVAILVQSIYFKRYNQEIPIYINGNELWVGSTSSKNNTNIISNALAKSFSINFNKKLEDGIEDLFNYLESE